MRKMSVKQLLGASAEWLIIIVVAAFLAMQSIEFWKFVTPDDKPLWVWFGFGLTGGGMIAYLVIIMWRADTAFKKYIAIAMLAVCTLGELATAGFGIKIEGWRSAGFSLTESDFNSMTTGVQLLALLHAAAMIAFVAGDKLAEAFGDEDGDGIPNFRDSDYKPAKRPQEARRAPQNAPMMANAAETKAETLDPTEAGK